MTSASSLVIADDSALLREGLAGLLERQGYDIVARESSAPALVERVDLLEAQGRLPDAVITDVRMPPSMRNDGLEAALAIRRRHPAVAIMVLSQYVSATYAQQLFAAEAPPDAGGTGYMLKDKGLGGRRLPGVLASGSGRRHGDRPRGHPGHGARLALGPGRPDAA